MQTHGYLKSCRNYHRHRLCPKPMNFDGITNETMKCPKGNVLEAFKF